MSDTEEKDVENIPLTDSEVRQIEVIKEEFRHSFEEDNEELIVEYVEHDLTPENTIVVFDLHHVLMRPEYKQMAKLIFRHPKKKQLLKVVSSPSLVRRFAKKIGSETPEKTMKDLENHFSETKHGVVVRDTLSPLIQEICNAQKPDLPTFEVIERLHKSGYGIYLLSNIGIEYFAALREKLHYDFFEHFAGFYTTNKTDDYVNKPNIKIFERFMERFNPGNKFEHVIFVDDSTKNINGCGAVGMIGIRYEDSIQLEKCLIDVGIKFTH